MLVDSGAVLDALKCAGYGPEEETCVFELTYNYGKDKYDNFKGEGYAQVALSSEVRQFCLSLCISILDTALYVTHCDTIW